MSSLYIITSAGFIVLTIISAFLLYTILQKGISLSPWGEERKQKIKSRMLFLLLVWFAFLSVFSITGVAGKFELFPFNMAPVLIIPLVIVLLLTFSKGTATVLHHIDIKELTRLQLFRFFVEVLLWMTFIQNLLPVQMTFEGRNWDILSGVTAPLIAHFFLKNKKALIIWNILCLGLLINIVTIAILSMPTPLRAFANEPANHIVTRFPFIFLPGFLVPLAYTLHFLSLRKLLSK
jgi:hypothetical protein